MLAIRKYLNIILSLPKSIFYSFLLFPFSQAIKVPIYISYRVKCKGLKKGCIILPSDLQVFMIKFGNGGSEGIEAGRSMIILNGNSKIVFKGRANFGEGIKLRLDNGEIIFGNNFRSNKNCFIASNTLVEMGKDVLVGWNVNIRDSDGHYIIENGTRNIKNREILIGDHVWICSYTDILKGVSIQKNSVVAYKSVVTSSFIEENVIIAGFPAKIIKRDINWEE